jgi:CRISPR-associated protein (TIGR03984 family)
MPTLFTYRSESSVSLPLAISLCASVLPEESTVALLYTPDRCKFGKLGDQTLLGADGKPIDLAPVFEARIFNQDVELRWVKTARGHNQAVLLSDEERKIEGFSVTCHAQTKILDTHHTYLLWGEVVQVDAHADSPLADGWSRLTTARIGPLDIPKTGITNRAILSGREYLAEVDEHGNVAVIEERLIALEDAP